MLSYWPWGVGRRVHDAQQTEACWPEIRQSSYKSRHHGRMKSCTKWRLSRWVEYNSAAERKQALMLASAWINPD